MNLQWKTGPKSVLIKIFWYWKACAT